MHDARRLGKHAATPDARTLRLARYLPPALPTPPTTVDWSREIPPAGWPLHANDQYGCCTAAAAAHLVQQWTEAVATAQTLPTDDVLAFYSRCSGFDPHQPTTDRGANMLAVLRRWKREGLRVTEPRHRIAAFVAVDPKDAREVRTALWLFGGLYAGIALPLSAQRPGPWRVVPGTEGTVNSWGGHAVALHADRPAWLRCATWGHDQPMTWDFLGTYCDELYAVLSPDWFDRQQKAPSGFDLATLQRDLAQIGA